MNLGVFKRKIDVDAEIQMTPLKSLYASGDKDAHVFELSLFRGTEEIDLSGASAQGYFIRADGYTVPITGAISGNVVALTLSESCYYVVGNFNLIIKVSIGESRKSVFWGNGYVVRSMTDAIVDGENVIPSLDELLAQISAAESAAKAANQAASAASSAATSAVQAASAANANASAANSAANAATAAASAATEAATKIDDMTVTASGLAAGAAPTAELTEVGGHYNIALGLPKGDKGEPGATPQITVQVKTGEPGTAASVKQTGTAEAPVIELTIPRGDTGSLGNLTINGKAPDSASKVTLTAADVKARPDTWTPTAADVGALGVDAQAQDSAKLGGKAPEYYAMNKTYVCNGMIFNGLSSAIEGVGACTIVCRPGGLAEVHFAVTITQAPASSETDVFDFGLNRDILHIKEAPQITPIAGGVATYLRDAKLDSNLFGKSGTFEVEGQFWKPARVYNDDGSAGSWPSSMFAVGMVIIGTCFGTYER